MGTVDNGDPSVVALFVHDPGKASGSLCSGTVISPHVVLTAAQCIDPRSVGGGKVFEVLTGATLSTATSLAVLGTTFDSAFNVNDLDAGHDIGFVELTTATTLPPLLNNRGALGSGPVRLVGYGTNTHTHGGAGTKREATTAIATQSSLLIKIGDSNARACHGDSGGPAFQTIDGQEVIIGIRSFGTDNSSTSECFGGSTHTRVDAFSELIADNLFAIGNTLRVRRWETQDGSFSRTQKWVAGDFDHDGKSDLALVFDEGGEASIDVHLSSGSGFGIERWQTTAGSFSGTQSWVAGDFDGDGKSDLAVVFNDRAEVSIDVHPSSGSGFGIERWQTRVGSFSDTQKWIAGDFDGDGKSDLAVVFDDGGEASIDVHLSSGTSFGVQRWQTRAGRFSDTQRWIAGDFDGDGKCDLAVVFNDGGEASVDAHLSNGNSFGIEHWQAKAGSFSDTQKWVAGDFDGDGKSDLAVVFNDGGEATIDVYRSNGTSFGMDRWASHQASFSEAQKWVAGDFTGDGKSDLANVFNDGGLASIDVHRQ